MTRRHPVADSQGMKARLVFLAETIEDGDLDTALAIVHDLLDELGGPAAGETRCRWCPLTDWPGAIQRHEHVVHAHELLDLEEAA